VCLYTDFTTCVLVQKEKSPPKAAAAAPPAAAAPAAPAATGKAGELEEKILAQVSNPSSSYFTGNMTFKKEPFLPFVPTTLFSPFIIVCLQFGLFT
jgi:hypothetical protein